MSIRVPQNRLFADVPADQITWRNMEDHSDTKDKTIGKPGVRYFAIKLDTDFANQLQDEGWNIIWRNVGTDEEPEMKAYLKIFIKYDSPLPTEVYLANPQTAEKFPVTGPELDALHIDGKKLDHIDVYVRPYHWHYLNDEGIKAQVEEMNIILAQSGLQDNYRVIRSQ